MGKSWKNWELDHELSEKYGYKGDRKLEKWEGRKNGDCTGASREMHGSKSALHGGKSELDRENGRVVDDFLHGEGVLRRFFREIGPKMGSLWRSGRRLLHNGPERAVFRRRVQTWFRADRPGQVSASGVFLWEVFPFSCLAVRVLSSFLM